LTGSRRSPFVVALFHLVYALAFALFLVVAAPWFAIRSLRDRTLRESLGARFGAGPRRATTSGRRCVWVHAVSVGEVKAARTLVQQLVATRPDTDVVVSSTTTAGLALARKTFASQLVVQFPLDVGFAVRRLFARLRPDLLVLVELEVWPNLLREAHRRAVPVVVVNGRMTERSSRRYRWFARWLPHFDWIERYAVQNDEYAQRLRELRVAPGSIVVTGNLKYDTLRTEVARDELERARRELGLADGERLVVAASTHEGEESAIVALLPELERDASSRVRLLVAPRHMDRVADVVRAIERAGLVAARLTQCRASPAAAAPPRGSVVVLDTIGELETFLALADVVFVGGSLVPVGGHNVLEPAALGRPTLYGPHTENFADEVALLARSGGGVQVADAESLRRELAGMVADPARAAAIGARGRAAVLAARGGTAKSLELVHSLLDRRAP
jgi:3-deoxy-D-manno-octulosonic-acid transferase